MSRVMYYNIEGKMVDAIVGTELHVITPDGLYEVVPPAAMMADPQCCDPVPYEPRSSDVPYFWLGADADRERDRDRLRALRQAFNRPPSR